jgi:hypothetical protein
VIVFIGGGAPSWAEGSNRPSSAPSGTWKPDPGALDDFGHAVAARYSGDFAGLPRVRRFQLWAEPNFSIYLTPQWQGGRPFAPDHYRAMLNAFGAGVESVHKGNVVVTGGTAPYGDSRRNGQRLQPVRFWRDFFCLRGRKLKRAKCSDRARFDVLAHHPINVGGPTRHARNSLDASTPDIRRIKRVLRKAERTGRAKGAKRHPIWATEIWWDSKPPDPLGVPQRRHARWLQQSFYLLWRQGVTTVVWFLIRDQGPGGNYAGTQQSGLFLRDGAPKRAHAAFRFPFVADRRGDAKVRLWGKAPSKGSLTIERRRGGSWRRIARARARGSGVFSKRVALRGKAKLRAKQGGETSLVWALR